jgi:hypothetical protein
MCPVKRAPDEETSRRVAWTAREAHAERLACLRRRLLKVHRSAISGAAVAVQALDG